MSELMRKTLQKALAYLKKISYDKNIVLKYKSITYEMKIIQEVQGQTPKDNLGKESRSWASRRKW